MEGNRLPNTRDHHRLWSKQREEEEQDHLDDAIKRLFFYTDSEIPDEGGRI